MGNVHNQINAIMEWEIFMPVLVRIPMEEAKRPGGRPALHPMLKVLVLQSLVGLSDERTQYQILDRRSVHDFFDINEADIVKDQNTICEFRKRLPRAQLHDGAFAAYTGRLEEKGFITRKGNIVDALFVEVPRQRNRRAENDSIKNGEVLDGWEEGSKRLGRRDLDAKWAKKNQQTFYGYKNRANVALESKLIIRAELTDASVHDSQALGPGTCEGDAKASLDSGYVWPSFKAVLAGKGILVKICEKYTCNHCLTVKEELSNRVKSRKCYRIIHVFVCMTINMKTMVKRYIGLERNRILIIF